MSVDPDNLSRGSTPIPPVGPVAPGSGLPINVAAGLASLFTLPGGLVFMFLDRKEPYVRFYAIQGIVLGAIAFLLGTVQWLMTVIFTPIPFLGKFFLGVFGFVLALVWLVWMAIWVVSTVCAFSGKQWRVPFLSTLLARYISRIP